MSLVRIRDAHRTDQRYRKNKLRQTKKMETDQILIIVCGAIFLIFGVGFIFAKTDESARKKDEKRFGPLPNISMGGWYILGQNKILKYFMIAIFIMIGLIFIISGLAQIFSL
ncbi:MAG: hypothetical protein GY699_05785 [Desulfobacteraceae bacterium]|nr:hypothetical protein [Desulfobacteraceae bacterium]